MNIYRLSQSKNRGYDTYDSCVVVAPDAEEARRMHPRGDLRWIGSVDDRSGRWVWLDNPSVTSSGFGWADPDNVIAKHIGTALEGTPPGVICASFNAG